MALVQIIYHSKFNQTDIYVISIGVIPGNKQYISVQETNK